MKTLITTSVVALALSSSFAAASGFSTHDSGLGVIAPPMSTSSAASKGAAVGEVTPGKAQIAKQLGLNPAEYSSAELTRIQNALRNDNVEEANFVISHTNRQPVDVAPQPVMGRDA